MPVTALLNHRDHDQGSSPEPQRTPDRHESVAVLLRRARKEHGQDVRSVAQVLRIRQGYIEALESGQFERLPGMAYALGFLRTYAEYLGLDPVYIVDRYKMEVQGAERRTELIFPEPANEGRIPGGALILISLVLVAVAYGGWIYLSNQGRSVAELIPPMPEQLQALIESEPATAPAATDTPVPPQPPAPSPAAQTASVEAAPVVAPLPKEPKPAPPEATDQAAAPAAPAERASDTSAPAEEAAPARKPARTEAAGSDTAPVQSSAPSQPAAPQSTREDRQETRAPSPTVEQTVVIPSPPAAPSGFGMPGDRQPRVYGETSAAPRIVLRATQDSWVQVRDRQNALLLTRVLRAGDSYRVPNQEGLTLLTGNAGGIAVEVDGQSLPPLGPLGAVRRNIPLEPDRLLSGDLSRR